MGYAKIVVRTWDLAYFPPCTMSLINTPSAQVFPNEAAFSPVIVNSSSEHAYLLYIK